MSISFETLEALVSVSQTLLRANGRWWICYAHEETVDTLRSDIRATVFDAARLFRWVDCDQDVMIESAVRELERRAILPSQLAA